MAVADHLSLPAADIIIREGRMIGVSWLALATRLGVTPAWVRRRAADVLNIPTEQKAAPVERHEPIPRGIDPNGPLPAGHPLTWGAISKEPWPYQHQPDLGVIE